MQRIMTTAYQKWLRNPNAIKLEIIFILLTEKGSPEEIINITESFLPDLLDRYHGLFTPGRHTMLWHYKGWDFVLYSVWRILDFVIPLLLHLVYKKLPPQYIQDYVKRFSAFEYRYSETDYYYNMLIKIAKVEGGDTDAKNHLMSYRTHAHGLLSFYELFSKEYHSRESTLIDNYVTNVFCEHVGNLSKLKVLIPKKLFPFLEFLLLRSPYKVENFLKSFYAMNDKYFPLIRAQLKKEKIERWEDLFLRISLYFRFYEELPRFNSIHQLSNVLCSTLDYKIEDDEDLKKMEKYPHAEFQFFLNEALREKYTFILKFPLLLKICEKQEKNERTEIKLIPRWKAFANSDRQDAKKACLAGAICGMFYRKRLPLDAGREIAKHLNYEVKAPLSLVNKKANRYSGKAFKQYSETAVAALARKEFK